MRKWHAYYPQKIMLLLSKLLFELAHGPRGALQSEVSQLHNTMLIADII